MSGKSDIRAADDEETEIDWKKNIKFFTAVGYNSKEKRKLVTELHFRHATR